MHFSSCRGCVNAQHHGNLVIRQFMLDVQQERGTVQLRQRLQFRQHRPQFIPRVLTASAGYLFGHFAMMPLMPPSSPVEIPHDCEQVGPHGAELDPLARLPDPGERFGREILSLCRVPAQAKRESIDRLRVFAV